jgi:circadian clock protein KaiA
LHPQFSICTLLHTQALTLVVRQALEGSGQSVEIFLAREKFLNFVEHHKHQTDCLVIENSAGFDQLLAQLQQRSILLPMVVLEVEGSGNTQSSAVATAIAALESKAAKSPYQQICVRLMISQIDQIDQFIEQAISRFLKLSPALNSTYGDSHSDLQIDTSQHSSLAAQQRRLSDHLKERLGYLGVYYKRNPHSFVRYMDADERKDFLKQLKQNYREIILCYFSKEESKLNEKIDTFVNMAFFADVAVSQVVELHMVLMDEFAKQLKLEGRSEEILLDYRLTLIDVLAHLCEMYRRSIPRES